eukprot:15867800-Heterocapsa_arctica.AAC.1
MLRESDRKVAGLDDLAAEELERYVPLVEVELLADLVLCSGIKMSNARPEAIGYRLGYGRALSLADHEAKIIENMRMCTLDLQGSMRIFSR